jgi:ketosteroid isomerase-like protein
LNDKRPHPGLEELTPAKSTFASAPRASPRGGARQDGARLQDCPGTQNGEETMDIDRRQLALPALAIGLLGVVPAFAASAEEEAVAKRVEAFRAAQVAADAKAFDALCAAELSYSHSDGRVEDKAAFIANATNGKSKFLSLKYEDTKVQVVGNAAIVRFHWLGEAEAVADGKKSSTNLHILMNWQKQGADWKLLSRASTKL